jgi:hypothetical protein
MHAEMPLTGDFPGIPQPKKFMVGLPVHRITVCCKSSHQCLAGRHQLLLRDGGLNLPHCAGPRGVSVHD